jgi:pyruvate/2-oxoglutarate dehydrogenase complex dihydrolipoamide dehydrogenase (E3) component
MTIVEKTTAAQPLRNTDVEEFDLAILGGGTGSTIAAWTFGGQGQRVAVIERKYIGGSCPNIACLPSKNIIHSAKVASYLRRSEEFGIAKKDFTVDMAVVRRRKRNMVSALNAVYLDNSKKTGVELILGSGRFVGPKPWKSRLRQAGVAAFMGRMSSSVQARVLPSKRSPGLPRRSP